MRKGIFRAVNLLALAALTVVAGCSYGPPVDRSRFMTAHLLPEQRVLFTYHKFIYRPATGIAAFPDGGIPEYITDVSYVGTYEIAGGRHRTLRKEKNTIWEPGQGTFQIVAVKGFMALLSQGGQLRGKSAYGVRRWLCNTASGDMREIDLAGEFARRNRDVGEIYLVDDKGTLVFINNRLDDAREGRRNPRADGAGPEIWVRTAGGTFLKVAESWHYEGFEDGKVVYWMPDDRTFYAFNVTTRTTVPLPGYKIQSLPRVTEGAGISTKGDRLELGHKTGDKWVYAPLPFEPDF
jgi:hypothetical protein